ncbi:hypothetical protein DSM112329_00440 [Paraconexibacter sp. AEG42_29]|uniref:SGNH hydrolase-type esterase domain-containing protein n=1 Tax=Paraconexibacter sp. AEG42_29 TaxID=2997339 RepID=A0AAU7AQ46_9ACTN
MADFLGRGTSGLRACAAAGLAAALAVVAPVAHSQDPPARPMSLTASAAAPGHIELSVTGVPGDVVQLSEVFGGREFPLKLITVTSGSATVPDITTWRCDRSVRRFIARSGSTNGPPRTATAVVRTPSCAHRLAMVAVPARVRPGKATTVRLTDRWRLGGYFADVCATSAAGLERCRRVRVPPGRLRHKTQVRLAREGTWTLSAKPTFGSAVQRTVSVRRGVALRVLVTGDSMTYGIFNDLARRLAPTGGTVRGDPNPGTGVSKPEFVNWPVHARVINKAVRPDVTFVMLGAAGDSEPLTTDAGNEAVCCGPAWVAEYSRRLREIMRTFTRDGHSLVYWALLPAPRPTADRPQRPAQWHAVNTAILLAAKTFPDGVIVIDKIGNVISPGDVWTESITYKGRSVVVREPDGVHLNKTGTGIAAGIIYRQLAADGMLRP